MTTIPEITDADWELLATKYEWARAECPGLQVLGQIFHSTKDEKSCSCPGDGTRTYRPITPAEATLRLELIMLHRTKERFSEALTGGDNNDRMEWMFEHNVKKGWRMVGEENLYPWGSTPTIAVILAILSLEKEEHMDG